jgi:hypothetical protein
MQDADLFLELAAIAGVFVGFGALIAVRSGGASGQEEVAYTRGLVALGLLALLAAVAPVTLARYDLTGHPVWALSSVLTLLGFFGIWALQLRTPEYRANLAAEAERSRRHRVIQGAFSGGYMLALMLLPVVILLGLVPDLESAVYFTVVVLYLVGDGWFLLGLVFSQRQPAVA